jgi:hypothetical protein
MPMAGTVNGLTMKPEGGSSSRVTPLLNTGVRCMDKPLTTNMRRGLRTSFGMTLLLTKERVDQIKRYKILNMVARIISIRRAINILMPRKLSNLKFPKISSLSPIMALISQEGREKHTRNISLQSK